MKRALKIILFSFLSVIGVFALIIGGMYVFGGFNEKAVFAQELHFNKDEVISATSFELDLLSNTSDVTRTELKIEVSSGGDNIIYYNKTARIGERIQIAPKRDDSGKNIGGYVRLTARYADEDSTSIARAVCNILIDVPVQEVSVKDVSSRQYEEQILLASQGDRLSDFITVSPVGCLKPYSSMSVINNAGMHTLTNKKIFLEATYREEPDSHYATLLCGGVNSTLVELPYEYNSTLNDFVISRDVYLLPKEPILNLGINCYIVPTFEMMNENNVSVDRIKAMSTTSSQQSIFVKNYSIDAMSFDHSDKTIYMGENLKMYIDNEEVDSDCVNLNFKLINNSAIPVDDELLKKYLSVKVLYGEDETSLTMRPADLDSSPKSEWYYEYTYSDFRNYYDYIQEPVGTNKFKILLEYNDGDSQIQDFFYLVPDIYNAESLAVKQNVYSKKNGDVLSFDGEVSVVPSAHDPISSEIGYFVALSTANNVSTMPTETGEYKVTFDFTLNTNNKISTLGIYPGSNWATLNGATVTMSQNNNIVFSGTVNSLGNMSITTNEDVEAGMPIHVEISGLNITTPVNGVASLFKITTEFGNEVITSRQTKFYHSTSSVPSAIPYLSLDNVVYDCDFEYVTIDSTDYIHLLPQDEASLSLSGVGSFTVTAMLLYTEMDSGIFFLSRSITFRVDVEEVLDNSSILVYDGEDNANFTSSTIPFEENLAEDKYLFITSTKMLAFIPAVQSGKMHISVSQDFSALTDESLKSSPTLSAYLADDADGSKLRNIRSQLANINKDAITFDSTWTPVIVDGNIVGYKVKYNINEVYTITIDNKDVDNKFILNVYATTEQGTYNAIFKTDSSDLASITFNVSDKVINEVYFAYNSNSVTSLNITASIMADGELGWKVGDSVLASKTLSDLTYGLKYKDGSGIDSSVSYCSFYVDMDKTSTFSPLPSSYYSFDANGNLSFRNFPYREDGSVVRMYVRVPAVSSGNPQYCHYVYNSKSNTFDKRMYDELADGKYIDFNVTSLDISILLNEIDVTGYKNNQIPLFGNSTSGSLFQVTITDYTSTPNYADLFTAELMRLGTSSAIDLTSINDEGKLSIDRDFIKDEDLGFKFSYYGDSTYPFIVNGVSDVYSKKISSAFKIELTTNYEAPSNEDYATFIYTSTNTDAYARDGVTLSMTSLTDTYASLYTIDNPTHKISFKTCTESYTFGVRMTITITDDEGERTATFDYVNAITVTPTFTAGMLEVGRINPDTSEMEPLVMYAGENNGLVMNNGITLKEALSSQKSSIESVLVSFSNTSQSIIDASLHMSQNAHADVDNVGFFSYDMSEETTVRVTFTFNFDDGGAFVATKVVTIQPNLDVVWSGQSLTDKARSLNSGKSINLTLNTNFIIFRDGDRVGAINEEYFESDGIEGVARYSRSSFEFQNVGDGAYFNDVNISDPTSDYILYVNYGTEMMSKSVNILFKYVVETELDSGSYVINITMPLILNIKVL